MGGTDVGRPLQVDDQPREDPCGKAQRGGSETVVSGFHAPVLPRPAWPRSSSSERVPVDPLAEPHPPPTARVAGREPGNPDSDVDRAGEPAATRLETILLAWLPADGVSSSEPLSGALAHASSETSESASLSAAERGVVLRSVAAPRPAIPLTAALTPCACVSRIFRESRMREICQSGLKRGEETGSRPSLSYSTSRPA